jgi:hypothetical protein
MSCCASEKYARMEFMKAAIQGLNQKVEKENMELKQQNASLKKGLNELQATVKQLVPQKRGAYEENFFTFWSINSGHWLCAGLLD